jgi:hypothetical protein
VRACSVQSATFQPWRHISYTPAPPSSTRLAIPASASIACSPSNSARPPVAFRQCLLHHLVAEPGQLVEEEDAAVGQAELAGAGPADAAADQAGRARPGERLARGPHARTIKGDS